MKKYLLLEHNSLYVGVLLGPETYPACALVGQAHVQAGGADKCSIVEIISTIEYTTPSIKKFIPRED